MRIVLRAYTEDFPEKVGDCWEGQGIVSSHELDVARDPVMLVRERMRDLTELMVKELFKRGDESSSSGPFIHNASDRRRL